MLWKDLTEEEKQARLKRWGLSAPAPVEPTTPEEQPVELKGPLTPAVEEPVTPVVPEQTGLIGTLPESIQGVIPEAMKQPEFYQQAGRYIAKGVPSPFPGAEGAYRAIEGAADLLGVTTPIQAIAKDMGGGVGEILTGKSLPQGQEPFLTTAPKVITAGTTDTLSNKALGLAALSDITTQRGKDLEKISQELDNFTPQEWKDTAARVTQRDMSSFMKQVETYPKAALYSTLQQLPLMADTIAAQSIGKAIGSVPGMIAGAIPGVGAVGKVATRIGGALGQFGLGWASMAANEAGSYMKAATDNLIKAGVDPEQAKQLAQKEALEYGAISGLTEYADNAFTLMRGIKPLMGKLGKDKGELWKLLEKTDLFQKLVDRLPSSTRAILVPFQTAGAESATEGLQTKLQNVFMSQTFDEAERVTGRKLERPKPESIKEAMLQAAGPGFILGSPGMGQRRALSTQEKINELKSTNKNEVDDRISNGIEDYFKSNKGDVDSDRLVERAIKSEYTRRQKEEAAKQAETVPTVPSEVAPTRTTPPPLTPPPLPTEITELNPVSGLLSADGDAKNQEALLGYVNQAGLPTAPALQGLVPSETISPTPTTSTLQTTQGEASPSQSIAEGVGLGVFPSQQTQPQQGVIQNAAQARTRIDETGQVQGIEGGTEGRIRLRDNAENRLETGTRETPTAEAPRLDVGNVVTEQAPVVLPQARQSVNDIQTTIAPVVSTLENKDDVKVVDTTKELPAEIQSEIESKKKQGIVVDAVYHNGQLYLVAENIRTPEQATAKVLHEVAERGMSVLGEEQLGSILDKVYEGRALNQKESYAKAVKAVNAAYPGFKGKAMKKMNKSQRRMFIQEVIAHIAENRKRMPTIWSRFVRAFRGFIERAFKGTRLESRFAQVTDAQVEALIDKALIAGKKSAKQQDTRYSQMKESEPLSDVDLMESILAGAGIQKEKIEKIKTKMSTEEYKAKAKIRIEEMKRRLAVKAEREAMIKERARKIVPKEYMAAIPAARARKPLIKEVSKVKEEALKTQEALNKKLDTLRAKIEKQKVSISQEKERIKRVIEETIDSVVASTQKASTIKGFKLYSRVRTIARIIASSAKTKVEDFIPMLSESIDETEKIIRSNSFEGAIKKEDEISFKDMMLDNLITDAKLKKKLLRLFNGDVIETFAFLKQFVTSIGTSKSLINKARKALKKITPKLENVDKLKITTERIEDLRNFLKDNNLTREEIDKMTSAIKMYQLRQKLTEFLNTLNAEKKQRKKDRIETIKDNAKLLGEKIEKYHKDQTKIKPKQSTLHDIVSGSTLSLDIQWSKIAGETSKTLNSIIKAIKDGVRETSRFANYYNKRFNDSVEFIKNKVEFRTKKIPVEVYVNGTNKKQSVGITKAEAVGFLVNMADPETANIAVHNGFKTFDWYKTNKKIKGSTVDENIANINSVVNMFHGEELYNVYTLVENIIKDVQDISKRKDMIAVSEYLFGHNIFRNEKYTHPRLVDTISKEAKPKEPLPSADFTWIDGNSFSQNLIEYMSVFKSRSKMHGHPLVIRDVFDVHNDYIDKMSRFANLAIPINTMWNTIKGSQAMINEKLGEQFYRDILGNLQEISGVKTFRNTSNLVKLLNVISRRISATMVGLKINTVLVTRIAGSFSLYASLARQLPELVESKNNFKSFIAAMTLFTPQRFKISRRNRDILNTIIENEPTLKDRWFKDTMSSFIPVNRRDEYLKNRLAVLGRDIDNFQFSFMAKAEMRSAVAAFKAVKRISQQNGTPRSDKEVANIINTAIVESQNPARLLETSAALRAIKEHGLAFIYPFVGQSFVMHNQLVRTQVALKNARIDLQEAEEQQSLPAATMEDKQNVAEARRRYIIAKRQHIATVVSTIFATATEVAISQLLNPFNWLPDKEETPEEETKKRKFLADVMANMAGRMITLLLPGPLARSIPYDDVIRNISYIINNISFEDETKKIKTKFRLNNTDLITGQLQNIYDAANNIVKYMEKSDEWTEQVKTNEIIKIAKEFATPLSAAFNLPGGQQMSNIAGWILQYRKYVQKTGRDPIKNFYEDITDDPYGYIVKSLTK